MKRSDALSAGVFRSIREFHSQAAALCAVARCNSVEHPIVNPPQYSVIDAEVYSQLYAQLDAKQHRFFYPFEHPVKHRFLDTEQHSQP